MLMSMERVLVSVSPYTWYRLEVRMHSMALIIKICTISSFSELHAPTYSTKH